MRIYKEDGSIVVDGGNSLLLTKDGYALHFDLNVRPIENPGLIIRNWHIYNVTKKYIATLAALKFIWSGE